MKSKIAKLTIHSIKYLIASIVIVGSILSLKSVNAQDNPAVKNGNPCIEDICINDEVKNLLQLNWEKVVIRNPSSSLLKAVGDPGAIKVFSKYVNAGWIDGIGLRAAGKIKGLCDNPLAGSMAGKSTLSAIYRNKKGQDVNVSFQFVSSEDGKSQRFVVSNLSSMRLASSSNQLPDCV